ncbi:uncharacterized protein LOC113300213 isoform X2 [Papaver somniferum]|uniref:uncharacterized protein LOC113300213 isoform X2 n=1 Tax=Papaver somniferum TaxID=3469 RepID=UPI000E6FB5FB|nr:uncharacterized protein LOC113300213 isoform X2 [Papaver somniferum]
MINLMKLEENLKIQHHIERTRCGRKQSGVYLDGVAPDGVVENRVVYIWTELLLMVRIFLGTKELHLKNPHLSCHWMGKLMPTWLEWRVVA